MTDQEQDQVNSKLDEIKATVEAHREQMGVVAEFLETLAKESAAHKEALIRLVEILKRLGKK